MSGTVNYPKVIDHLTDVIKELNVPCAEPPPAEATAAERHADAVDLLRGLLDELESHDADARAAEHGATDHGNKTNYTDQMKYVARAHKGQGASAKPANHALPTTPAPAVPPKPAGNLDPYRASAKAEKRGPPALA